MSPTDSQNSTPSSSVDLATLQAQVDQYADSISRLQQTVRSLQNVGGSGVGSTTPTKTRAGIAVPPVSGLSVQSLGTTSGANRIAVTFIEPAAPGSTSIDHYNIYTQLAQAQQESPTLIASTVHSPAVCTYVPSAANATTILVQTVLSNGQMNALANCPSTALQARVPTINAADINVNQFIVGPFGAFTLSGISWGATGSYVTWTPGVASYQGSSYAIAAGSSLLPFIYWNPQTPTALQISSTVPTGGASGVAFTVAINVATAGLYSPVIGVIDSSFHQNQMNAFSLNGYNHNANATFALGSINVSGATGGQLILTNGAGGNTITAQGVTVSSVAVVNVGNTQARGQVNVSDNAGAQMISADGNTGLTLNGSSACLAFPALVPNPAAASTTKGYIPILVTGSVYYLQTYQ